MSLKVAQLINYGQIQDSNMFVWLRNLHPSLIMLFRTGQGDSYLGHHH